MAIFVQSNNLEACVNIQLYGMLSPAHNYVIATHGCLGASVPRFLFGAAH